MTSIWVLADDRPGNVNQCLGVAEALQLPFEIKQIRYNPFVKLPNWCRGASLVGVDRQQSSALSAPWPEVVVAAGRRTAPVARYIKRQSQGKTRLVHIMWPDCTPKPFDLIAIPLHDRKRQGANILPITGSPHRVTQTVLQEAGRQWGNHFSHLPKPLIALIVGGSTKNHLFTPVHAGHLGNAASALASALGGALLVTTSRRTGTEATKSLLATISCPYYVHDWAQTGENPYFGYLACADAVIVTGDSMSMGSEAVATGKPVYIFAPKDITSAKHARFHQEIYKRGWAKPLWGAATEFWHYTPENPAEIIAEEIKRRCF